MTQAMLPVLQIGAVVARIDGDDHVVLGRVVGYSEHFVGVALYGDDGGHDSKDEDSAYYDPDFPSAKWWSVDAYTIVHMEGNEACLPEEVRGDDVDDWEYLKRKVLERTQDKMLRLMRGSLGFGLETPITPLVVHFDAGLLSGGVDVISDEDVAVGEDRDWICIGASSPVLEILRVSRRIESAVK